MTEPRVVRAAHWACIYCFVVNGLLYGSVMARIPALKAQTGLDEQALGQALLGFGLGALLAFPGSALLIRRLGARWLLPRACLALLLLFPLLGLSEGYWSLAVVLFALGVSGGALDVAVNVQAVEVERRLGRPCLSGMHGMYSLGGLLGALGAVALAGWTPLAHFAVVALPGVLALPLFARHFLPAAPARAEALTAVRAWPPLPVLALGLLALCAFVAEGAIADWSALFLHTAFASSERIAAVGFAAFSASMLLGRLCGDRLRLFCGDVVLLRGLAALALTGMLLALFASQVQGSIGGFALAGLGLSVMVPIIFSAAGNRPGVEPASGVATVAMFGYGGLLLGPPLIGLLAQHSGLRLALLLVVGLCAGLLLGAPWVRRVTR